ncbi:MAG: translational GTPase TypA [Patescibacteria group bacterium]
MEIRNIAIIAHVDHGKTALTDQLLKQTGMVTADFSMDTNALEKERGITIYSKNASLFYKNTKINIVDTPGHADFGSEVERVLRSIDSVILVVDAQEGPMPQTRFVLKKSLELGLEPIVVINKIDKTAARPEIVQEEVYELFLDLGASDEQLDFPVVYTVAREGVAKLNLDDRSNDLTPLLETIIAKVAPALSDTAKPLRLQPFNLAYDDFLGRLAIGRIYEGLVGTGDNVIIKKANGETRSGKITKLFTFNGLKREEAQSATAGDIIIIAGLPDIYIGETVCSFADQEPLPAISIDEPTICLNFLVNNSPFGGREGKLVTSKQIKERLLKELEVNVGLKVDFSASEFYKVYGRGELHIAILIENMRREGFELQISQPQVIIKETDGQKLEPYEEVTISVPGDYAGVVIEKLSKRRANILEMKQTNNQNQIIFNIPTRGLLGYRGEFTIDTRGEGILCSRFIGFKPYAGNIDKRDVGSMVSLSSGKAAAYALENLQNRGWLYIGPGENLYEGQVIGNVAKGNDLTVNPIKGKNLTNMRASGSDETIKLTPPWQLTLERGLETMAEDEYLEITPQSIRLRKQLLTEIDRLRQARKAS